MTMTLVLGLYEKLLLRYYSITFFVTYLVICCSSTGMLLEQHKQAILNLLSDPKLLEEQVNFSLKTLKEYVSHCR